MNNRVYLDYNATAPAHPDVIRLTAELMAAPGNASSVHAAGREARKHIESARSKVAALAGCRETQIVFNSGATEGNNTVLSAFRGRRILVSALEHPSVLEPAGEAENIPVTKDGLVDIAALRDMLARDPSPALVCVMMVNNETGVVQPIDEIAPLVKQSGALLLVDAVQAAGRIPIEMNRRGVDFLTLSAHKIGGPQGVGALIAGPCAQAPVLLRGGGQERRFRAGTENVAGIAGFGVAAELSLSEMASFGALATLRDALEQRLSSSIPELVILGRNAPRVPNTTLMALPGVASKTMLINLDLEGIAVSNGSACSSGKVFASHVTRAMGAPDEIAGSALRVSAGRDTKPEDTARFAEIFERLYARVKEKVVRVEW
ncbi:MAG: cysteine desulfurase [Alphaproteobacteria bacterium]|nr:cysteine desulfurase [Alphaproteobacteria bacterium]